MSAALPIREWSGVLWRVATSTNTRIVVSLTILFALVLTAGLYRQFRPGDAAGLAARHGGISGEGGGGQGGPGGKRRPLDPVDRFTETRVGHVLYYPVLGEACRRMLFDNTTGKTYDAPDVNCIPSEMNTAPLPGQEVNQTTDRVKEMSKHFNKK
jgi:hypothetical protein